MERYKSFFVVRSKVRDLAKKKKMNIGGDAADALSREIARLVDRAAERQKQTEGQQ